MTPAETETLRCSLHSRAREVVPDARNIRAILHAIDGTWAAKVELYVSLQDGDETIDLRIEPPPEMDVDPSVACEKVLTSLGDVYATAKINKVADVELKLMREATELHFQAELKIREAKRLKREREAK